MNRLKVKIVTCVVNDLIKRLSSKDMDKLYLNAKYQRKEIWKVESKQKYVMSIMANTAPSTLIFGYSVDDRNKCYVIDGVQRLSALRDFKKNKFFIEIDNNYVYYDDTNGNNGRIMTDDEKNTFLTTTLPVAIYKNLTYEQQVNIFNRIMNGEMMSKGEKVLSRIKDLDTAKLIEKNSNEIGEIIKSLPFINLSRKDHLEFCRHVLYCSIFLKRGNYKLSTSVSENDWKIFIKNNKNNLPGYYEKIMDISNILMGKFILQHKDIDLKQYNRKFILMLYITFYSHYRKIKCIKTKPLRRIIINCKKKYDGPNKKGYSNNDYNDLYGKIDDYIISKCKKIKKN